MKQKKTIKEILLQKIPNVIAFALTAGVALLALVVNVLMFFIG